MTRAIQPFFVVSQDIATGTPAFIRNALAQVRRLVPRLLKLRMLMVGCSAGEGDIVLERVSRSVSWTVDALKESLVPVARRLKAVLIVFKDYPKYYRRYLDRLRVSGFTRVPSMPAARMDLNFSDFEDYWRAAFARFVESIRTSAIYVTVDLDCLAESEAITNWENGRFLLADLDWAINFLRQKAKIIGGDLCGAFSPIRYASWFQSVAGRLDHPRQPCVTDRKRRSINLHALEVIWPILTEA